MTTTTTEFVGKICMVDTSVQSFFAYGLYDEVMEGEEITERNHIAIIARSPFRPDILDAFIHEKKISVICQELDFAIPFNEMSWRAEYELLKVQSANSGAK